MVKIIKNIVACILAIAVYFFAYAIVTIIIDFLGSIPIIRWLIYYPADASWAQICLPGPTAIALGSFCSMAIVKNAKLFCGLIGCLHALFIVMMFASGAFSWSMLFSNLFSIGAAVIMFNGNEIQ